jgi:serpin B
MPAFRSRRQILTGGAALAFVATPLRALAQASPPALADAFAADLVREVVAGKPEGNVVVSPFSVQGALALAALGARGEAREKLRAVIGPADLEAATLHDWFASPLLEASRAAFVRRVAIDPGYRRTIAQALGAQVRAMPAGAREAAGVVNAWADGATHHRIRQLVDKVPEAVPLLLADAVYLNFRWADEFRESATRDKPFHPTPESSVDVPMMRQVFHAVAGPIDVGMAALLPFADRAGDGMHVVLPRPGLSAEDALDAVLRDPQMLVPDARPGFTRQAVDLSLPRFEMGSDMSFVAALRRAGLASLFTQADFSGISPKLRDSRIGDVVQKAWMRVDEKGVEAAAATAVELALTAVPGASPPPPLKLVFDRPFAVVIRDKATLFAALVRNPLLRD